MKRDLPPNQIELLEFFIDPLAAKKNLGDEVKKVPTDEAIREKPAVAFNRERRSIQAKGAEYTYSHVRSVFRSTNQTVLLKIVWKNGKHCATTLLMANGEMFEWR